MSALDSTSSETVFRRVACDSFHRTLSSLFEKIWIYCQGKFASGSNRARNWGIGRAGEACRLGLTRQQWQDSERELGTPLFGIFRGLVAWIEWEVRQEKALDHRRAHEP